MKLLTGCQTTSSVLLFYNQALADQQFEFRLTSTENPESKALLQYIRQAYPDSLKEKFNAFRPALIAAHGQPTSDSPSGTSTPNPAASSSSYAPAPPAKSETKADKPVASGSGSKVGNTATVEVKATLQASADDIWGLLTDEKRIPMWSRSAAKVSMRLGTVLMIDELDSWITV
jgi:activator of HSP90 ATPase